MNNKDRGGSRPLGRGLADLDKILQCLNQVLFISKFDHIILTCFPLTKIGDLLLRNIQRKRKKKKKERKRKKGRGRGKEIKAMVKGKDM